MSKAMNPDRFDPAIQKIEIEKHAFRGMSTEQSIYLGYRCVGRPLLKKGMRSLGLRVVPADANYGSLGSPTTL